jgi:SET domain-containing protein
MAEDLVVRRVDRKGRCVFANRPFARGERALVCPVLPLTPEEADHANKTPLEHYLYCWGEEGGLAVVLGYGSLINHSHDPNLEFDQDHAELSMNFVARRDIAAGEELTIDYGIPLWFDYVG